MKTFEELEAFNELTETYFPGIGLITDDEDLTLSTVYSSNAKTISGERVFKFYAKPDEDKLYENGFHIEFVQFLKKHNYYAEWRDNKIIWIDIIEIKS